jgi:hypothetical protein
MERPASHQPSHIISSNRNRAGAFVFSGRNPTGVLVGAVFLVMIIKSPIAD